MIILSFLNQNILIKVKTSKLVGGGTKETFANTMNIFFQKFTRKPVDKCERSHLWGSQVPVTSSWLVQMWHDCFTVVNKCKFNQSWWQDRTPVIWVVWPIVIYCSMTLGTYNNSMFFVGLKNARQVIVVGNKQLRIFI